MTLAAKEQEKRKRSPVRAGEILWPKEDHLIRGDIDVEKLVLDVIAKGIPGIRIEDLITSGDVTRTIEGGSTVTLQVHDAARAILRSGRLHDEEGRLQVIDIHLDGLDFRLAKIGKSGDTLNLTFEDRTVARLKAKHGPRKGANRAQVTRAQYIKQLIRSIKAERVPLRIHELKVEQPIGKADKREPRRKREEQRDDERQRGFAPGARPGGLNARQLDRVTRCLNVAERVRAPAKAVLSMLVAGYGESDWGENVGSRGTTFQTLMIPEAELETQAYHFLKGGRSFRTGGAIGYLRANPSASLGTVAKAVEISDGSAAYYDSFRGKAVAVLEAWGGAVSDTVFKSKPYTFKVKKDESYWEAIQRLASEVNWRAFVTGGKFYYISEEDLYASRPRFRFSEDEPGIDNIDFDWDYRKRVAKLTVTNRLKRWAMPPGVVALVEDLGPASGRWLVESVTRPLYSSQATTILKLPMPERPEPLPERTQVEQGAAGVGGSGSVTELMDICRRFSGPYKWGGGHGPALSSLSTGQGLDCSSSCSLALRLAGLYNTNVAMVSGGFATSYGEPGRGKEFTVYAHSGHVYIQFEGPNSAYRFDTSPQSGDVPSSRGPRLRRGSRSSAGFVARHFPGH